MAISESLKRGIRNSRLPLYVTVVIVLIVVGVVAYVLSSSPPQSSKPLNIPAAIDFDWRPRQYFGQIAQIINTDNGIIYESGKISETTHTVTDIFGTAHVYNITQYKTYTTYPSGLNLTIKVWNVNGTAALASYKYRVPDTSSFSNIPITPEVMDCMDLYPC